MCVCYEEGCLGVRLGLNDGGVWNGRPCMSVGMYLRECMEAVCICGREGEDLMCGDLFGNCEGQSVHCSVWDANGEGAGYV